MLHIEKINNAYNCNYYILLTAFTVSRNLRNNKTELENCMYTFKTDRTVCCKKTNPTMQRAYSTVHKSNRPVQEM